MSDQNFIDPLEGDFFEGDISGVKLTTQESPSPSSTSEEGDSVIIKNAVKNTYQLWPGKEIPYVISNSFRGSERSVIREAMEQFARQVPSAYYWILEHWNNNNYVAKMNLFRKSILAVLKKETFQAYVEPFLCRHSCVKWRPHIPTDRNYVHILRDQGCYSRVGKTGGAQVLSLGKVDYF